MGDTPRNLNEAQQRRLIATFQHADKLLSEIEHILSASASKSPFPKYVSDLTPAQERVVRDYIARIRGQVMRVLAGLDIHVPDPAFGAIHSIRVHLSFIRVAIQEASPKDLAGYGPLPEELLPELNGFSNELETLVERLDRFLAQGPGYDVEQRLQRLTAAGDHVDLVKKLERIISSYGLVEFRPALANIVDRLASPRFEIAVFGQVSSGKSSLLNHITGIDVLPVGVSPVTSVPTRLIHGKPRLTVGFAGGRVEQLDLDEIGEFVSEERNPANAKGVAKIVASIPSERLSEGIVFVDTPGLGSLATSGAAETRAYLPQCDLGLVLVNAGSTLIAEDIQLIQTLHEDGIPALVLVSKIDLLSEAERERFLRYIAEQLERNLGMAIPVHPVSVVPRYSDLTDRWFAEQIEPLYAKQQALALESIRRKIALLREAVAIAMRSKIGETAETSLPPEDLRDAERDLRSAGGRIAEVERRVLDLTDAIRSAGEGALDDAAQGLAAEWRSGRVEPVQDVVREVLGRTAARNAAEVRNELETLGRELMEAIGRANKVLGWTREVLGDEFERLLREVPQIDLSGIQIDSNGRQGAFMGRYLLDRRARSRLRTVKNDVDAAFISYARLLQFWARAALRGITEAFESRAGTVRAQLDRLISPGEVPDETRRKMRQDLEGIGVPQAGGR